MTIVASIVEGYSEVDALPVLLRRMGAWLSPNMGIEISRPSRVQRERFLNRDAEFRRHLLLAAAKCGDSGWILILLDADDDCPSEKGAQILQRARECVPHRRISVVLANREYEAWFLAAADSLHGQRGFLFDNPQNLEAERPRDAKGWMKQRMTTGYDPTIDQPAFSAIMDLQQARQNSRSFRKLCSEWTRQMDSTG